MPPLGKEIGRWVRSNQQILDGCAKHFEKDCQDSEDELSTRNTFNKQHICP